MACIEVEDSQMRISHGLIAIGVALLWFCSTAHAIPDEAFNAWRASLAQSRSQLAAQGNATQEQWGAMYCRLITQIDFNELRPTQIDWMRDNGLIDTRRWGACGRDHREMALRIAHERKDDPGPEGAAARALFAALTIKLAEEGMDAGPLIQAALMHPGIDQALKSGSLTTLNYLLAYESPPEVRSRFKKEYVAYALKLPSAAPEMAAYSEIIFRHVTSLDALPLQDLEDLRLGLVSLVERAKREASLGEPSLAFFKDGYARTLLMLEAHGLVGKPAPELAFTWVSADRPLKSLSDLRGSVVVLDFWATWCAPCVGTFPNMRRLVEHYDGFPVEVVGVTSLQGGTQFPGDDDGTPAATAEEEHAQMAEFIKVMDITWVIAFSREDIFQLDYGVNGIPHMVIIDPAGVVRHRRLHPILPLKNKAEMIDTILNEFDLPVPERATTEENGG